ncbi:MAG TPA: hypothetical protein PKV53_11275, partial [Anaerohalosphaeraceae bacterium]|nr:hypothetical protein [Anaerohalosphaeraceae bacterium]
MEPLVFLSFCSLFVVLLFNRDIKKIEGRLKNDPLNHIDKTIEITACRPLPRQDYSKALARRIPHVHFTTA